MGSSPYGLLIECTYIADGTDAEFTDAIWQRSSLCV